MGDKPWLKEGPITTCTVCSGTGQVADEEVIAPVEVAEEAAKSASEDTEAVDKAADHANTENANLEQDPSAVQSEGSSEASTDTSSESPVVGGDSSESAPDQSASAEQVL